MIGEGRVFQSYSYLGVTCEVVGILPVVMGDSTRSHDSHTGHMTVT